MKRLSAEQFVDAVFALTSTWPWPLIPDCTDESGRSRTRGPTGSDRGCPSEQQLTFSETSPARPMPAHQPLKGAKWLWSQAEARQAAPPQTIYLRRLWSLEQPPDRAIATFTADNSFEFFINGNSLVKRFRQLELHRYRRTPLGCLRPGKNVVAVKAINGGNAPNPAGVIGEIVAFGRRWQIRRAALLLATDESWRVSEKEPAAAG